MVSVPFVSKMCYTFRRWRVICYQYPALQTREKVILHQNEAFIVNAEGEMLAHAQESTKRIFCERRTIVRKSRSEVAGQKDTISGTKGLDT